MIRLGIALLLVLAGVVWSVMFPKRPDLGPDMVASIAIGVGLIGTGVLVWASKHLRTSTTVLSILLLWSLATNSYLWSEVDRFVEVLEGLTEEVR